MAESLNVGAVTARVRAALNAAAEPVTEGLLFGAPETAAQRVLVCLTPTVDTIRRAVTDKRTLIVSREHPLFQHDGAGGWSGGIADKYATDAVLKAKHKFITESGVAIYRVYSAWDKADPQAVARALAVRMGWKPLASTDAKAKHVVCDIAPTTIDAVAQLAASRSGARAMRAMGDSIRRYRRVALVPGFRNVADYSAALADPAVDLVVTGESCEWDGATYLKDAVDAGNRPLGVLFAGFVATEEPGAAEMAPWLRKLIPEIDVAYVTTTTVQRAA